MRGVVEICDGRIWGRDRISEVLFDVVIEEGDMIVGLIRDRECLEVLLRRRGESYGKEE